MSEKTDTVAAHIETTRKLRADAEAKAQAKAEKQRQRAIDAIQAHRAKIGQPLGE